MAAKRKVKTVKKNRAADILTAAEELIGERGFDAVSARDVAERAGVNKALLFYYYESKEKLFDKVLERYHQSHYDALKDSFEEGGESRERFHRLIDAYFDFIAENVLYARLMQGLVVSQSDRLEKLKKQLWPLFRWIEEVLGTLTPKKASLAPRHFYVSFSGMVINYFTYGPVLEELWGADPLSPDAITERRAHLHWMVDTLLDGLEKEQLGES